MKKLLIKCWWNWHQKLGARSIISVANCKLLVCQEQSDASRTYSHIHLAEKTVLETISWNIQHSQIHKQRERSPLIFDKVDKLFFISLHIFERGEKFIVKSNVGQNIMWFRVAIWPFLKQFVRKKNLAILRPSKHTTVYEFSKYSWYILASFLFLAFFHLSIGPVLKLLMAKFGLFLFDGPWQPWREQNHLASLNMCTNDKPCFIKSSSMTTDCQKLIRVNEHCEEM